jgi:hypothetical protein
LLRFCALRECRVLAARRQPQVFSRVDFGSDRCVHRSQLPATAHEHLCRPGGSRLRRLVACGAQPRSSKWSIARQLLRPQIPHVAWSTQYCPMSSQLTLGDGWVRDRNRPMHERYLRSDSSLQRRTGPFNWSCLSAARAKMFVLSKRRSIVVPTRGIPHAGIKAPAACAMTSGYRRQAGFTSQFSFAK